MDSKCLSKCSLLVALSLALFLSAVAGFSGGRMGGSSFSSSRSSSWTKHSEYSNPYSSSSSFDLWSFRNFFGFHHQYHLPPPSWSSPHFYLERPRLAFSSETVRRFDNPRFTASRTNEESNDSGPNIIGSFLAADISSDQTLRRFDEPSFTVSSNEESHNGGSNIGSLPADVSSETVHRFDEPSFTVSRNEEGKNGSSNPDSLPAFSTETVRRFEKPSFIASRNEDNAHIGLVPLLLCLTVMALLFRIMIDPSYGASVIMVQVGLSGEVKWTLEGLNQIAKSADTSTDKGFHHVLTETIILLLQQHDYWNSVYSCVDKHRRVEESEKRFNQLSLGEREKVDIESLVNFNGVNLERNSKRKAKKLIKNYIVVTLLVAVRGGQRLPAIKTAEGLREALKYLSSISLKETMAVEVLWAPQVENDTLSKDELLEKYPLLRAI